MKTSDKLTGLDESQLRNLVPLHHKTICNAVARLYKGGFGKWERVSSGVAVLEVDKVDTKIYICFYSLTKSYKVFSTPLYGEMGYIGSTCQFHTFSADGFSYGLSFADVTDAQNFYNYVIGFLTSRPLISPYSSTEPLAKSGRIKAAKFGQILNKGKTLFKRKNDKESDAVIVVNDFKHTKHVGFSENSEFQIFAENEELANELIEALHLKINNKKEMQDVMNVIDRFGADQVRKALDPNKRRPAPLPPPSQPPPPTLPTSVPNTQPGRGDLLNSIIHFDASTLTKVNTVERKESTPDLMGSIQEALTQMLNQRREHLIQSDSDE